MFFDELSNDEWVLLAALVSDEPAVRLNRRGRPRAEPRIVANAVLWILTTGEPWSKLPGRYPSGPTCRRRFEEWQLNGTLLEMVRLLSHTGRTFAYVPQPALPVAAKPAAPATPAPVVRDEAMRGVSWKSPESWQAPGQSGGHAFSGAGSGTSGTGGTGSGTSGVTGSGWRAVDPIADITRQLSGLAQAAHVEPVRSAPARAAAGVANADVRLQASSQLRHDAHARYASHDTYAARAEALNGNVHTETRDIGAKDLHGTQNEPDAQRSPMMTSLAPRGNEVADRRGYSIYVAAEPVPNAMYRAWAEIMKDGRRVERSGLVGPRFAQASEAEQFALDWARQWIDRECRTQNAMLGVADIAGIAGASFSLDGSSGEGASYAESAEAQEQAHAEEPTDEQAAVTQEAEPVSLESLSVATLPPGVARPLPPIRQVPEPAVANHSAPLQGALQGPLQVPLQGPLNGPLHAPLSGQFHGPIGGLRGPLRRYPSEPAALPAEEGTSSERYPIHTELTSHAG